MQSGFSDEHNFNRPELVCLWCVYKLNQLQNLGLLTDGYYTIKLPGLSHLKNSIRAGFRPTNEEISEFVKAKDYEGGMEFSLVDEKDQESVIFMLTQCRELDNERLV